jgi:hypothetical protein
VAEFEEEEEAAGAEEEEAELVEGVEAGAVGLGTSQSAHWGNPSAPVPVRTSVLEWIARPLASVR